MLIIDTELEEYLPQILDQSKNGIIICDPNQKGNIVIFVNKITCERFGYKASDFLGNNCKFLQGTDKNQPQIKQISQAIKKQTSISVTLRNYKKTGELIHNQLTISPIFDKNGDLKYFLGIQKDVTKEIELEQKNKSLEDEKIDNAQYNAIGKLSAGLSHEINTPLTIIKGNMEMLRFAIDDIKEESTKKDILSDLAIIENNLSRIGHITESMREIADTNDFKIEKINLYRALVISLRLVHNKSKKITKINLENELFDLDIDREKKRFIIDGNSQKLEQAFIAIISNALDKLQLQENLDKNILNIDIIEHKKSYELIFQDNAGGVEENLLPDIFKPFKSKNDHRGLGIGLSVVKKIMDEHKFDITLENYNGGVKVSILIKK